MSAFIGRRRGCARRRRAARRSGRRRPRDSRSSAVCSAATVAYSRADDVDPGVGAGGGVEHHRARRRLDQPVARAQRPPLAGHRAVAADAEAGDVVVELDLEPVGGASPSRRRAGRPARCAPASRRGPGSARPDRRAAMLATGPARRRHRAAEGRSRPSAQSSKARASAAHHATILTSRSGTTITLRGGCAGELRLDLGRGERQRLGLVLGQARAARSSVSRSLPLTWTAMRHLVVDQQRRVDVRPGGVGDHARLAERRPGFLGEMRRHRRGEQHQGADRLVAARRRRGLLDRVGQLVERGDRLVELQPLDRLADRGDGPVRPCGRAPRPRRSPPAAPCASRHTRWTKRAAPSIPPPTIRGRARAGCRTA